MLLSKENNADVNRIRLKLTAPHVFLKPVLNEGGFLPLMGHRVYRHPPFKKEDIKDLFGKKLDGSIEIHIVYGDPDSDYIRRLKMKLDISLRLDESGAIADLIREEIDEPVF